MLLDKLLGMPYNSYVNVEDLSYLKYLASFGIYTKTKGQISLTFLLV